MADQQGSIDRRMKDGRITHIGGPTMLIEVPGRLLTDPTFDAPGRRYTFGWGTSSRKLPKLTVPSRVGRAPSDRTGQFDRRWTAHDRGTPQV
jgi:hypothetical protein